MDGHGSAVDDEIVVQLGETGETTRSFDEAGTVFIGCHQPGHYEAGMKATVRIA